MLLWKHQAAWQPKISLVSLGVPTCGDSTVAISCAPLTAVLVLDLPLVHKNPDWVQMQNLVQFCSIIYLQCQSNTLVYLAQFELFWIVDLDCMTNQWCSAQVILIMFVWSEFMTLPRTQSKLSNPVTSRSYAIEVERLLRTSWAGVLLRLQVPEILGSHGPGKFPLGSCPICPSIPFITFWKPSIPGHTATCWGLQHPVPLCRPLPPTSAFPRGLAWKSWTRKGHPKPTREEDIRKHLSRASSSEELFN